MRILTNISKAELDQLANQPTAKAMIEKVKTEGIYIPEGDSQGAAEFIAMRNQQKQDASLQISDEGMEALKKMSEENEKKVKEGNSQEEQIKEQIEKLRKELAEIKAKQAGSEKAKKALASKANAISQQISTLSMQLIQVQKASGDSNTL
ncbi:hypothetical protein [Pseudobutyrivibrio xylanivorans]|uniref:Uncharacterized protein n=1 Tax=Pseudobutyrivibrio xylanivorans TaxID=185007 RepID=A0A5P6VP74_PSEXY|nr:hypothetical protein [Pseudobutyrivibrio xylanivorans]QFJ54250.1 hypothetical protein FXF36_04890 [Pseudobutyrivibrio xylanivorans]